MKAKKLAVLLVEDSLADARLILEVFKEENVNAEISVVRDGEEAMEFLEKRNEFEKVDTPNLILLDLNLPKKDGREVLSEIKQNPHLNGIPVIVLTTSQSEDDVANCYKLQASCFVTKPIDLDRFVGVIRSLDEFWFSAVKFPPEPKTC
ncbi:MAG: response regulator [Candidatus Obscuribacterales bacterium]|nr:response regulator [Candidatus Obscuribacterales bacterium]